MATDWSTSGNRRFLFYYALWLLLTGFISMTYTNILQSTVVVPRIHQNGLTFEEMAEKNFSFWTPSGSSLTSAPNRHLDFSDKHQMTILYKEKLIIERLDGKNIHDSYNSFMQYLSESNRVAALLNRQVREPTLLAAALLGFDAVVGQEKFFNFPSWWSFRQVERASLLAKTLKQSQSFGLVTYFEKLYSSQVLVWYMGTAKKETSEQGNSDGSIPTVTIKDSLTQESLVLLLYGISLAAVVFFGEAITTFCHVGVIGRKTDGAESEPCAAL